MLKIAFTELNLEVGIDEAGRGCLAGPVVAAAVIFPKTYSNPDLNDSKKISYGKRMSLRQTILQDSFYWGIGMASETEIDQINILQATFLAMHRAIENLNVIPEFLLIDGNRFKPYKDIDYKCIVKGDSKYQHIAAASILAKTERDLLMEKFHQEYPSYDWINNRGYGTPKHIAAIEKNGFTPYHRKSFHLKNQTILEF